ncbi:MAG: CDP-diacylglycerol--glycerol-3-phosphate 3-phosphatidyltransferase [Rickettsiales bacterium]
MFTRQQIPNLLTFARVAAVPLCLIIMLFVPYQPAALFWIFVAASLTDFLDGYLARKWKVVSLLGTLLDPIADKLLVALMLVYLLMVSTVPFLISPLFLPVMVILLRELYIAGLREFLASRQIKLPVSKGGKLKTALQMFAVSLLLMQLVYEAIPMPLYCTAPFAPPFTETCSAPIPRLAAVLSSFGLPLLYAAALLAFTSAVGYTRAAMKALR